MVWRGWSWRSLGAALLVPIAAGTAAAAELRAVTATVGAEGARVALSFSAPARPVVHEVARAGGGVRRLYLDLPAGTGVRAGMPRALGPAAPVAALRVGMADGGVPRIVVELAVPASYEVDARGATYVMTLRPVGPAAPRPVAAVVPERAAPAPARVAPAGPAPAVPVRAAGRRPPARRAPRAAAPVAPLKIVLDPGHGGRDPGARGYAVEKEVTLAIARRLARLLHERVGAETVLTRLDDSTVPLAARTARANAEGADLFVSIHANASERSRSQGIETYYLNNTNDRATIRLAAMENGVGAAKPAAGETDLRYILSDLVQVGKMDESIALAQAIQRALVGHLRRGYADVTDLGVKRGPFYVLVGAHMPCVLVETSFLTHPVEGRRLARSAYRDAVAEGLYAGIARFLTDSRRAQTL